jgi:hypothetical protein
LGRSATKKYGIFTLMSCTLALSDVTSTTEFSLIDLDSRDTLVIQIAPPRTAYGLDERVQLCVNKYVHTHTHMYVFTYMRKLVRICLRALGTISMRCVLILFRFSCVQYVCSADTTYFTDLF